MTGWIQLISSKYPPAFGVEGVKYKIEFQYKPMMGQSFTFESAEFGSCHTSTIEAIDSERGAYILKTKNSYYKLEGGNEI